MIGSLENLVQSCMTVWIFKHPEWREDVAINGDATRFVAMTVRAGIAFLNWFEENGYGDPERCAANRRALLDLPEKDFIPLVVNEQMARTDE